MDKKVALQVALANTNSTIEVLRDNSEFNIIHSNLNTVKLILENQLKSLESNVDISTEHSDAYYDYNRNDPNAENPFTDVNDVLRSDAVVNKKNTYRIEEETTTGWTLVDSEYVNLSKEEAQQKVDALIQTGTTPSRIRVVVDGSV
tara:strand:- start:298 stop:735 length:438 start_codon:yes stop_codon:yes gene_type:complete